MARSRNIKPQFFLNEHLAQKSPYARLLFIGLWCLADCRGRMEDRPMRIKAALFPYEPVDIDALLNELAMGPEYFIVRYEVDGNRYIEIPNFGKHQNPHKNEKEVGSRIPTFSEKIPRSTVQVPELYQSSTELAPDLHSTTPADSLLLIPDSLTLKPEVDASASECVSVNGLGNISEENRNLGKEGMNYLISLNHPNFSNPQWVAGYLAIQFQELEQSRSDIPKPEIMRLWQDTCDLATEKNKPGVQWSKSTFKNKLDAWTPNTAKTLAPEPAIDRSLSEKTRELLTFPFIQHSITGQLFKSEELEIRPESPDGLTDSRNNYYPCGHLQGLTEVPA
jgi:hypothetical protein